MDFVKHEWLLDKLEACLRADPADGAKELVVMLSLASLQAEQSRRQYLVSLEAMSEELAVAAARMRQCIAADPLWDEDGTPDGPDEEAGR